ncbi:MAG: hypothetical protein IAF08_00290 [Rhizobacter sp.]|nr:hypothetical protein [Chlorobiales bacterium]
MPENNFHHQLQTRRRRFLRLTERIKTISRRITLLRTAAMIILFSGITLQATVGFEYGWVMMLAGFIAFMVLVQIHNRIKFRLQLSGEMTAYTDRSLEQLQLQSPPQPQWPQSLAQPVYPAHAFDLALVGKKSLSELLDRTTSASARLKLERALVFGTADITSQREIMRLLASHYGFGAKFISLSRLQRIGNVDAAEFETWLQHPITINTAARWLGLAGIAGVAAGLWFGFPVYLGFALLAALTLTVGPKLRAAYLPLQGLDKATQGLSQLSKEFGKLKEKPPELSPLLKTSVIRESEKFVAFANVANDGLMYFIFNALFWYDIWVVHGIKRFQKNYGALLLKMLDDVSMLESYISLSHTLHLDGMTFASDTVNIHSSNVAAADGASGVAGSVIEAKALQHPLIQNAVPNDARVLEKEVFIITGSNMSGKTTFLRTIGLALVMHRAGLPVRAASAVIAAGGGVMTSIAITDDLSAGESFFYAEVKTLKAMIERAKAGPLVCIIDEMLKGTNTRERLIASQSVITVLRSLGATVLISTHDVELSNVEGVRNFHFNEQAGAGLLAFDYKLKQGIIESTNALKILESQGIPISY